ncbi:MAG TPA: GNAT family N-acetyltransferase [Bacteroidales bacterium]|jgi:ribosomal protein S18 acetylase RimI-like enzyme|nr:GNAT family N-acetyltransferase [Bacteroidales bacterium]
MEKIEIRRVTHDDIPTLQEIGRQTFSETFSAVNTDENMTKYLSQRFSTEKLNDEVSNENSEFYFASARDRVIGYLKINTGNAQTELQDHKALEIERIYILQEFQRKKVGQMLYEKALNIARGKKAGFIWLGVWEHNLKAQNFYRKNGFKEFDRHIFVLGDSRQTDYMMKLELPTSTE